MKVLILYTGGTIGMRPLASVDHTKRLAPAPLDDLAPQLLANIPGDVDCTLDVLRDDTGGLLDPIDSSNVAPRHWRSIARAIVDTYDGYDAFVVLHGTDTMAYTGAALSFALEGLAKPVVLTGSMKPAFEVGSDAQKNVSAALAFAKAAATLSPARSEVTLAFSGALLRANRARKVGTRKFKGFYAPNFAPLGGLVDGPELYEPAFRRAAPGAVLNVHSGFCEAVATLFLHPGLNREFVQNILTADEIRGVVLQSFGAGNAPEDAAFLHAIENAVRADKVVLNTTQCLEGAVSMERYQAGSSLANAGVISGGDMTPEAAIVKLMWLLENHASGEARRLAAMDLRGELTPGC